MAASSARFLLSALLLIAAMAWPDAASAKRGKYQGGKYPQGEPAGVGNYTPGTIVIRTGQRRLYYVTAGGRTVSYPVGVGRAGKVWHGTKYIEGKYRNPSWSPPPEIRRDKPNLPDLIPGGSPSNPMGVAALTLSGGAYAIHGTNSPRSIGGYVSYGCIRMHNADILDLFNRVGVGTPVVVTR